jgi:hypothetical protein
MPKNITSIGEFAFARCKALKIFSLPEDISQIPAGCFTACESLSHIRIPLSVVEIKAEAFAECPALADIEFEHDSADVLIIEDGAFMLSGSLETRISCPNSDKPNGALKDYVWGLSGRIVEFISK